MVVKELKIDPEIVTNLQRLSVEVDSRKSLIAFMLTNDLDISSERSLKYEEEYRKYFLEYEQQKNLFEKEVIIPSFAPQKVLKWNLDFNTEIVTVELED